MAEKRRGLGRGLGALIPNSDQGSLGAVENKNGNEAEGSDQINEKAKSEKKSSGSKSPSPKQKTTPAVTKNSRSQSQKTPSSKDEPAESASSRPKRASENVSRETSKSQEETSHQPLKGSKKKRADMGVALRNTTSARRPADFFFGDSEAAGNSLVPVPGAEFAVVKVKDIHPNRKQPRSEFDEQDMQELVHSVKEIGVLQPIVIRPSRENGAEQYELVMGERRWRATQQAGLDTIPAIIRETQDVDLLRDALLENLHRSQLNPIEEAAAYQQLLEEFGTTQEQLAQKIGRSRPQISNTIRLLKLPALVQRRVAAGVISSGHARALLSMRNQAEIEKLAQKIVNEGLSVRAVEELAASSTESTQTKRKAPQAQKHHERLDYIADAFSDKLDTNVKIQLGARKGKMTIEFASVEDLNRIISVLDPAMEK